jgi:cell division protein FtsI (penicillin-binding protein 3)
MKLSSVDRKRLVFVAFFIFGLFALLILQFYKIQIREGDKWTRIAEAQHRHVVTEPCRRGTFYANTSIKQGHPQAPCPLVIDVPFFHLFVNPSVVPLSSRDLIAGKICGILALDSGEATKLREQFNKKSRHRKLRMWVGIDARDAILEWWAAFAKAQKIERNALYFVQDYKRSYPFGKMLGQVLHTVREDGSIPTGGMEMMFNSVLTGKPGKRLMTRSPRHALDVGKTMVSPENGADIYLTVNHYLQAIAEEEIAKGVKHSNAKAGWAIMMHPQTGEVYALAQYPFFDPASYKEFFNDVALRENTKVKGITDPYEPGSTIKPLTIAICFKANQELIRRGEKPLFSSSEKVETSNGRFPGRSSLIKDTSTHRYLNLAMAMWKSSDVYMARMVQRIIERLGADWYRDALENFGLGLKTGIELPAEGAGMLPKPGKKYASGALQWSVPTPYSMSYGYNLLVNSFQMLRSYGILANGGFDVKPTLVRQIIRKNRDGTETILVDNTVKRPLKRVLDREIVEEVVRVMRYTTKPGGTAVRADIYGYSEVGKTGTAEKVVGGKYSKKTHFSSFIGFAPVKDPQFVLLIAMDEPETKYVPGVGKNHMGGLCCAPIFREIGSRALQYLGVEPDDPYGYPAGDPRHDAEKGDWIKECRALKSLYDTWNMP